MNKIKQFVKNHSVIVGGVIVVGTVATAQYAATRLALNQLDVTRVGFNRETEKIRIFFKNGNSIIYDAPPQ